MNCRFCSAPLSRVFIDLGAAPPSNAFLTEAELAGPETCYPLKLFVCDRCLLVQIDEYKNSQEIFSERYAYFSSYSTSWLDHARQYEAMITERLGLGPRSLVLEIASNDGYLLQYFQRRGIPCLGIEPTANTARVARERGIEVVTDFFGVSLARRLAAEDRRPDLIVGNNVLAHVPDLHDLVGGMQILLGGRGTITMEFPHLMRLVEGNQFDTIYHEHFSYFSFTTVNRIFAAHGLTLFDVEEWPTHGGSLRIYGRHDQDASRPVSPRVGELLAREEKAGMTNPAYYAGFQARADGVKADLLEFLLRQRREGRTVAAYGAAAKGNTLLNHCGVRRDLVAFVADASPHKQGLFLPGSRIPVVSEAEIRRTRPESVLILPWNIQEEIMDQLHYIGEWGGRFVIPIPRLAIRPAAGGRG